jgi:hypothetical protein
MWCSIDILMFRRNGLGQTKKRPEEIPAVFAIADEAED